MTNQPLATPENALSKLFAVVATISYDYAKWIIAICLIGLITIIANIQQLKTELSIEGRLEESNPVRINFNGFREQFGRDDLITVSLPVPNGIDEDTIKTIFTLQENISNNVPYFKEVTSIVNARMSYGEDDELIVEDILEHWPEKTLAEQWPEKSLTPYLQNSPNYQNRLISDDASHIAIAVELQSHVKDADGNLQLISEAQSSEAVQHLYQTLEEMNLADTVLVTGISVINERLSHAIVTGTIKVTSLATLLILGFLWFFFRRISGVIIPIIVVNLSVLFAIGFMLLNNTPWHLSFGVLPPILLAVGIADSVHILSVFYKHFAGDVHKRQTVIYAVSHSAPAVLLTSLTTATGFASFATAELVSIADLGIYSAIAVAFALLFSVVLIPACLAVIKLSTHETKNQSLHWLEAFCTGCVKLSCKFPKTITALAVVVLIAGATNAIMNLRISDDTIKNFRPTERIYQDFVKLDKLYRGVDVIEIIIDSQEDNGIHNPEFLQKVEALSQSLTNAKIEDIAFTSTYSVLNIIKETHKALNNNDASFYALPDNKALIAQELLLFEMSERDDLLKVTDEDYRRARITAKIEHDDSVAYYKMIQTLQKTLDENFGEGNSYITGSSALAAESIPRTLTSMMNSYAFALIIITVLMGLMIMSLRIGIISMIPNVLPIVLVLNLMVLLDWPLDQTTISIGAIALGLVVDDTLHFMYHFKQQWLKLKHASKAAIAAIEGCGTALVITTVAFGTACLMNTLSPLVPFFVYAISLFSVAFLALLTDLLVAPAVLTLAFGDKKAD